MIRFNDVSKKFNKKQVISSLSFHVEKGETLAILGPNGAGKTTLLRLLLGIIPPSDGDIALYGDNVELHSMKHKHTIGVVLEEQNFFLDMSAHEYLHFMGELYQVNKIESRINELMSFMNLKHSLHKTVKAFSTGMKKKLNIVQAILHQPSLLIMDELFSGLDPIGIEMVFELISQLKNEGTTLVISSHILSGLESFVDSLLILDKGHTIAFGNRNELYLQASLEKHLHLEIIHDTHSEITLFKKELQFLFETQVLGEQLYIIKTGRDIQETITKVSRLIHTHKIIVTSLRIEEPTIRTLYSSLIGMKRGIEC